MSLLRSLLFNLFFYLGVIVVFLIALPALILPAKVTLLFGKLLGHYTVFVVRFFLNTKVEFKGDLNARVDSLIASLKNNKELKHFLQHL